MNREQVMKNLEPMSKVATRTVDHGARSRVVLQPDVIVVQPGDRRHALTIPRQSEGEKALTSFLGIPHKLSTSVQPDTYGRLLNDLLGRTGRYEVVMMGTEIVSFKEPGKNASMPPERVVRAIVSGIRGEVDFHRVHVINYDVTLEVTGTKEVPVMKGDLVRGGAMVHFSPIGSIRPSVQAFVLRLECTNGMTSNHALREYLFSGGGNGDGGGDILNWLRASTRDAYRAVKDVAGSYRKMVDEAISPEDRAMVLTNLIKQTGLGPDEAAAVQARAIERPPQNSYDMMNLITWATSHVVEEPRRIRRAQQIVATFVDETEHARVCPVCRKSR